MLFHAWGGGAESTLRCAYRDRKGQLGGGGGGGGVEEEMVVAAVVVDVEEVSK